MKMLTLTGLGGNKFPVLPAWVQMARLPYTHEFHEGAKSVIVLSGFNVAVQETMDQILEMLKDA